MVVVRADLERLPLISSWIILPFLHITIRLYSQVSEQQFRNRQKTFVPAKLAKLWSEPNRNEKS